LAARPGRSFVGRAAHRVLCLIPRYRRRSAKDAAGRPAAPSSATGGRKADTGPTAVPAGPVALNDREAIGRLLADIKANGLHATAGKIQLVHLDSVRRKFGARWAAVSARAMDLAERVLRDRLEASDVFTRYEDFAFVIVFSMIDDDVARSRADAISQRIHELLMADPELAGAFEVETVTAPVDELLLEDVAPTLETLDQGLTPAPANQRTAPIRGAAEWMGALSLGYQPLFHVPERTIGVYVAMPHRELPDGTVLFGESAYPPGANGSLTEELDQLLTDRVIADLQMPVNAGRTRIVATVISLHTLSNSSKLLYRLGRLSDDVRRRFAVEIVGLSDGVPVGAVSDAAGKLRNVAGHVALRLSLTDTDIERFAPCGLRSIGCDLEHPDVAALSAGEREAAIQAFVERVKSTESCAHIYGISTMDTLKTAIAAGADYLSGDSIAPCSDTPRPVRRLATED
jgi:hypothetical protein